MPGADQPSSEPVPGESTPGDSRDVPVAHDEAMAGTSERLSSIQKGEPPPTADASEEDG
jgi:hypothetical protein